MHRFAVEEPAGVEVDWGGHDEKSPFHARCLPSPHGLIQIFLAGIFSRRQGHVDDANDEGQNCDQNGENQASAMVHLCR